MAEKMGTDTMEAARVIKEHQGYHETEVSCGGEADLHRHLKRCKKNPGHSQFIPVQDFKMEHLPLGCQDNDLLDCIKAEVDLTCRLSVRYTSESRPQFHPVRQDPYPFYQDRGGDWLRTGTGWIGRVFKYTEEDNKVCICEDCSTPDAHTPKKVWGQVDIMTACHVVFDSHEARQTTCELWYDKSSTHVSLCPTLTGLNVMISDIEYDVCAMTCVTHDMDLIEKLYKMHNHRINQWKKVIDKYGSDINTGPGVSGGSVVINPSPVVIISHPHGCSKMVTVGMWTDRKTFGDVFRDKTETGWEGDYVATSYSYNTPTCPGSSGAPVFRLPEKRKKWVWMMNYHPHSEGSSGNNNNSGYGLECVSIITWPKDI